MSGHFFACDHARLHLVGEADATDSLGDLDRPAQACRAVFLAAEVSAVTWDSARWPELEFGVWFDEPDPRTSRRRRAAGATSVELSVWLQLRPQWPQLGGASIEWTPPHPATASTTVADRLRRLVDDAVGALNDLYRQAREMAEELSPPAARTPRPAPGSADMAGPLGVGLRALADAPVTSAPANAAPTAAVTTRATTRTIVATAAAAERNIADVLAQLVRTVEAQTGDAATLRLDHAVTPLPPNGTQTGRYLVSVTATVQPR
jgi:hypothetical protein